MSIVEQSELAEKVLGMLMRRVMRDETTDHTGFTISKRKLGEHIGKVIADIERGALQPVKYAKKFTIDQPTKDNAKGEKE